jgi:hypothetical protein
MNVLLDTHTTRRPPRGPVGFFGNSASAREQLQRPCHRMPRIQYFIQRTAGDSGQLGGTDGMRQRREGALSGLRLPRQTVVKALLIRRFWARIPRGRTTKPQVGAHVGGESRRAGGRHPVIIQ